MVLSKKLRVFLLSLLVVILAVSSAYAKQYNWYGSVNNDWQTAGNWSTDKTARTGAPGVSSGGAGDLPDDDANKESYDVCISKDSTINLSGALNGITAITVSGDAKVTLNLGTYPINNAGLRLRVLGKSSLTINGTAGGIAVTSVSNDIRVWSVDKEATLVFNAPITFANNDANSKLSLDIKVSGKLTVGNLSVLGNTVTVSTDNGSTITFSASGTVNPQLNLGEGTVLDVASGQTVTLQARTRGNSARTFKKDGEGELILAGRAIPVTSTALAGAYQRYDNGVFSSDITSIDVTKGTLTLSAATDSTHTNAYYPTSKDANGKLNEYRYFPAIVVPTSSSVTNVNVADGAVLNINTYAFKQEKGAKLKIKLNGTANIGSHAVFSDNDNSNKGMEVAQYSSVSFDNSVSFDVGTTGTLNFTGTQYVSGLKTDTGSKVTVADGQELILSADIADEIKGDLEADTIGLVGIHNKYPFGSTAKIDTLKVYGQLFLKEDDFDGEVYLRMTQTRNSKIEDGTSFRNNISVGKLVISEDVSLSTLRIDGAGQTSKIAAISFSGDKGTLEVENLILHANASEINGSSSDVYKEAGAFVLSGDGTLTLNNVTGGTSAQVAKSALRVQNKATLDLKGTVPAANGIMISGDSKLKIAGGGKFEGDLRLVSGSTVELTLTDANTNTGDYALKVSGLRVEGNMTLRPNLEDDNIGTMNSSYGRRYKVMGTAISRDFVADKKKTDITLSGDNAELFVEKSTSVYKISEDAFTDTGIELAIRARIQQAVLAKSSDITYDKDAFVNGESFTLTVPFTYSSAFADHYRRFIKPYPNTFNQNGIMATLRIPEGSSNVIIEGVSSQPRADITVTLSWDIPSIVKVTNSDQQGTNTKNQKYIDIDGLKPTYFISSTKTYTLGEERTPPAPAGSGDVYSDAVTISVNTNSITEGEGSVVVTITGVQKTQDRASMPVLVNGVYIWDKGDDAGTTYEIRSGDTYIPLTKLELNIGETAIELLPESIDSSTSGRITVTLPASVFGDVTTPERKEISFVGTTANGKITTASSFTLEIIPDNYEKFNVTAKTYTQGDTDTIRTEDTSPLTNVTFISDDLPAGFVWNNDAATGTVALEVGENAALGTHNFSVIAYNTTGGKVYNFSVTINARRVFSATMEEAEGSSQVEGTNYSAYVEFDEDDLPEGVTSSDVRYVLVPDARSDWLTFSNIGGVFYVGGVVPEFDSNNEENNEYSYIVRVTAGDEVASADGSITVEATDEDNAPKDPSEATNALTTVIADDSGDIHSATQNYSVTISYKNPDNYGETIDDFNLPYWLVANEILDDEENVIGYTIKFAEGAQVDRGTQGVVRYTDLNMEDIISWTVTFDDDTVVRPELKANPNPVAITLGETGITTLTLTPATEGVTYSADVAWATISDDTVTFEPTAAGTTVVKITAILNDATIASTDVTVNVTDGSTSAYTLNANPTTVSVTLGGTGTTTLTLTPAAEGVTYTPSVSWASVSNDVVTFTPTAAGTTVVRITAALNGATIASTDVTVNVTGGSGTNEQPINVSDPINGNASRGSDVVGTITPEKPVESWEVYVDGVRVENATVTQNADGSYTVSVPVGDDAAAGTHTVTVKANYTDGTSSAETPLGTYTVPQAAGTVGSSGGGCDAGFGVLALAFAAPLFLRKRRS